MKEHIYAALHSSQQMLATFTGNENNIQKIAAAAELLVTTLTNGNRIYSCGNGGSMSDAMHFAEELSGRYRKNRKGLSATAISDAGHITCVANDYGYEFIFSRYLEAHARPGDCLFAISTSGQSKNVLKATEYAKNNGMQVISLTGRAASPLGLLADIDLSAGGSDFADRVQEIHIKIIHILLELVERKFFPENYS
ncbi:MAG: SIS domain-containing protein [Pseudomonadota bacterium]